MSKYSHPNYDVLQCVSFRTDMHETGFLDLFFPEEHVEELWFFVLLLVDELGLFKNDERSLSLPIGTLFFSMFSSDCLEFISEMKEYVRKKRRFFYSTCGYICIHMLSSDLRFKSRSV